jgi:hypothetical protein
MRLGDSASTRSATPNMNTPTDTAIGQPPSTMRLTTAPRAPSCPSRSSSIPKTYWPVAPSSFRACIAADVLTPRNRRRGWHRLCDLHSSVIPYLLDPGLAERF